MPALTADRGRVVSREVAGPLGDRVRAEFGLLDEDRTAVLEMSAASGLHLLAPEQRDPLHTTTYGAGELIHAALDAGGDSGSSWHRAGCCGANIAGFRRRWPGSHGAPAHRIARPGGAGARSREVDAT